MWVRVRVWAQGVGREAWGMGGAGMGAMGNG